MRQPIFGNITKKIRTQTFVDLIDECIALEKKGYKLYKASYKTHWPYFWKRTYKATMHMPVVMDLDREAITTYDYKEITNL